MLPSEKNKLTISILGKLRDKGAPAPGPFPGEQEATSQDLDLNAMGTETTGESDLLAPLQKRKKKLPPPAGPAY